MAFGIWVFGMFADKVGRRPALLTFQAGAFVMVLVYSQLTDANALLIGGAVMGMFVNGMLGGYGALLSELYPTEAGPPPRTCCSSRPRRRRLRPAGGRAPGGELFVHGRHRAARHDLLIDMWRPWRLSRAEGPAIGIAAGGALLLSRLRGEGRGEGRVPCSHSLRYPLTDALRASTSPAGGRGKQPP